MIIVPMFSISLCWKPTSKVFHFKNGLEIDLPEDVLNYISKTYANKFIIKTIDSVQIENFNNAKKCLELSVNQENTKENKLFELLEVQHLDVKLIIEKALEKNIITRKSACYYYKEALIAKSINKTKEVLEKDLDLLSKINSEL